MLSEMLQRGLRELAIDLDSARQAQLIDYLSLLARWNKAYNLTAVRDQPSMVTRHLLDSLSVHAHLKGQRFIDVGTGAGLPGIPLAIASPERHFTLLDSNGKKTRFLVQAKAELKLVNVDVVHARVEDYRPDACFDAVLSRAFASLGDMMRGCRHLLAPGGAFLAMKGQRPDEELRRLGSQIAEVSVIPLSVPGLSEERCLLCFKPQPA
jgi:16S rRNA (guanine527-N7)-methyltransferase